MAEQYAVIDSNGKIQNVVLWDGKSNWLPQEGLKVVACNKDECMIGGTYINGTFLLPDSEPYTSEELLEQKVSKKNKLLDDAATRIAILQDAVSLEMATEDERASLIELQRYRVLLNRIDVSSTADINWPVMPAL